MFNSAAAALIKKNLFFSDALSQGGWDFLCECPLCCPAQLGGSLVTICLPRLRPAAVGSTLLPWALPCCCGVHPVAMGSALLLWALPCCHGLCPAVVGSFNRPLFHKGAAAFWGFTPYPCCLKLGYITSEDCEIAKLLTFFFL